MRMQARQRAAINRMRRNRMRIHFAGVTVLIWMMSSLLMAQDSSWKPCPRCQSEAQAAASARTVKGQPFDAHDLSGIWGRNGVTLSNEVPPMTPWGQAKFDAAKPGMG